MKGDWPLVFIIAITLVMIGMITVVAVLVPGAPHHIYHQNYQCPFG